MQQTNEDMNLAWQFIANTGISVFLTGKAGTGKTTFLKNLSESMPKRMVVLAPTGVAAINAGGQTIHSFFQLPFGPYVPGMQRKDDSSRAFKMHQLKKNLIRTLDLLVIDEVSMVRADLLDQIDEVMRRYRDWRKPFGGVQLLLIGDLMQLSPVVTDEEWPLLSKHYQTPYFFSSHALRELRYITIELRHIYRQQDKEFIDLLSHVRVGNVTKEVIEALNSRYIPNFKPDTDGGWIRLTTHNNAARMYNDQYLEQLTTPLHEISAEIEGDFPEINFPTESVLTLKVGAQVMFVKNDPSGARQYYNGKIGNVLDIEPKIIKVKCEGDETVIDVPRVEWENVKYTLDEKTMEIKEKVVGAFRQFPLRLAWAITVHKSQGLTFDHAVLDVNSSFAHGQVYVALSRCRTLDGIVLSSPLQPMSVITDPAVNRYIDACTADAAKSMQELPRLRYEYLLTLLDELFTFRTLYDSFKRLKELIEQLLFLKYPRLVERVNEVDRILTTDIISVAERFRPQYYTAIYQSNGNISDSAIGKRINDAFAYFKTKLNDDVCPFLRDTVVSIENVQTAEKFNNAYDALKFDVDSKINIFGMLENETFGVQTYLNAKAKALLGSEAKKQTRAASTTKKEEKSKKRRLHRNSTALETFNLFNAGRTIEEVAKERNLQVSTIYSHLAVFVETGELDINRVVSAIHQRIIRKVIEQSEGAITPNSVRERVPEEINYGEIKMVLAQHNAQSGK